VTRPTARRLRKQPESDIGSQLVVVCPQCGERFSIADSEPCADRAFVERRAREWLLDQFVWDHIQESKHRGSIPLPDVEELVRGTRRTKS